MDNIKTKRRLIHASEALEILNTSAYPGQRPLRSFHVQYLASTMRKGHFRQGAQVNLVAYNGQHFLINGQHTLHAIVQCQIPQWLDIQTIYVTSEADIAHEYARHGRELPRTLHDATSGNSAVQALGLAPSRVPYYLAAVPWVIEGWPAGQISRTSSWGAGWYDVEWRTEALLAWTDEIRTIEEGLCGAPSGYVRPLFRAGIVSVMLCTCRHTGIDAFEFWRDVAHDDGLREGHPGKALVHFMLRTPAKMHMPGLYARFVANAWNAAFEERDLSIVRRQDLYQPIRIAGTPFDGKLQQKYRTADMRELLYDPVPVD